MRILFESRGFSFAELLVAVGVLSIVMVGMLQVFVSASVLGELAGNGSGSMDEALSVMEQIEATDYDQISVNYAQGGTPGDTFNTTNPPGKGVITLDTTTPGLLGVTIEVSYRNKYNRVIGEDRDLDGVLDSGEDVNGNGKLDSAISLTTYIAKR